MEPPGILTIQSWVAFGHVGNAAAVFALQRLGFEAWAVNTVQFSNHTGYRTWRGRVFEAAAVAEVIEGVAERGALPRCAAVLSGYLGDASLGEVVLDAVRRVKAANPAALWCCDPVMGDEGRGCFVRPEIPLFFRSRALPRADIVTPNQFELEFLTGLRIDSLETALAACAAARALGPRTVLLTSLRRPEAGRGQIEMIASTAAGAWLVATPLLPLSVGGAGDLVAALFLAHLLRSADAGAALAAAAAGVHAVLEETRRRGACELQLIAAQDELAAPRTRFTALRVG